MSGSEFLNSAEMAQHSEIFECQLEANCGNGWDNVTNSNSIKKC